MTPSVIPTVAAPNPQCQLLAGSILAFGLALSPAWASTPKDTLVVAKNIDDMITLDPAETYELSGGALFHAAGSAIAGDLSGRLEAAGFTVRRAVLYRAEPATALTQPTRAALAARAIDMVVLFSPRTAKTFSALLREAGLAVPADMSVVGIDGHFLSTLSNPMLTTVELPVRQMARAMVQRVMRGSPDDSEDEPG